MQILVLSTDFILFSFDRAKEKEPKRKLADCTSTAKMAHLFPKRCKTTASRSYWCSALNGKRYSISLRCSSEVGIAIDSKL